MRRALGYICMFLGALALVLGISAKPLIYKKLAEVPLNQDSVSVSTGDHMSALSVSSEGVKVLKDVTLRSERKVVGIPGKAKGNSAFWQTTVTSSAVGVGNLSYSDEGVSFDRTTGLANNCCGDYRAVGNDKAPDKEAVREPTKHEGLVFKFPFDVQKKDYPWWDGDLGRTQTMAFQRTETLDGVETYVFQQKSGPEVYGKRTGLPGSIFGTDKPVDADAIYQNTRTLWIEPNTGVVIKGVEQQNKVLKPTSDPSLEPAPVTVGTIGYDEATVKKNAADWGPKGSMLGFLNGPLTWIGIIVGLVLLALGALLTFTGRRDAGAHGGDEYHDVADDRGPSDGDPLADVR